MSEQASPSVSGSTPRELPLLLLLSGLCLALRLAVGADVVLDVDALNFGAAALRFSVIDTQPHPPGYPGYVLLLKAIHGVAPGLGPVEIARWGSRLCSLGVVWAAWAAARELCPAGSRAPLWAASVAVLQPLLWYYGVDGQSHAVEALVTLGLFWGAARVRRSGGVVPLLLLAAAFGLSGALRPNIPALCSPLLIWALWGRPLRDWLLVAVAGALGVVAWAVPLLDSVGGLAMFRRLNAALYGDLFLRNFSPLGGGVTWGRTAVNLTTLLFALIWAAPAFALWSRGRGAGWRRALAATLALNVVFYAATYVAEAGYLISVAALSCLVPASWEERGGPIVARAAVLLLAPLLLLAGPERLPVLGADGEIEAPTLARARSMAREQRAWDQLICERAGPGTTLVVSDLPVTLAARLLPWLCEDVVAGMYSGPNPLSPEMDGWLVFDRLELVTLPTEVPMEVGSPARGALPRPPTRVMVSPTASPGFLHAVAQSAECPPEVGAELLGSPDWRSGPIAWSPRCLPSIRVGGNVLDVAAKAQ